MSYSEYTNIRVYLFLMNTGKTLLSLDSTSFDGENNYLPVIEYIEDSEEVLRSAKRILSKFAGMELVADRFEIFGLLHDEEEANISFFIAATILLDNIINHDTQFAWFELDNLPISMDKILKSALEDYLMGVRFNSVENITYKVRQQNNA